MKKWLPNAAIIAGLIIGIIGGYYAYTYPIETKIYNLANEIIGAGLFFVAVGMLGRFISKK